MIRNYVKIALRSLWKSKVHSSINVLGLSLGIGCCILIVLFVKDEWTFDAFHSKAERIYRVYAREDWGENQQFFSTNTPFPMGPTLKDNFPEVESQVRFNKIGALVKVGENQFAETISIGGQDFLNMFDFKLIEGDRKNALLGQNNAVITIGMAQKLFGSADPLDKIISIQLNEVFEEFAVKAIIENTPINSSIQFGILISDLNYSRLYNAEVLTSAWFNINPETYVLLREGTDPKEVEKKFPSVFRTILGEKDYVESKYAPGLQALTSIHLDTNYPVGIAPVSDPKYSYILSFIAFLLLFVACTNFVTLSVGRSIQRAKEVGIRKVVGAERIQLIFQFVGEALLVTIISLSIGVLLSILGLPVFNDLAGKNLVLNPDGFMLLMVISLVVVIGLIAGSYPAFVLSNFKPISILKGKIQTGGSKQGLRKVLVGVQLVLSIFLISSTLVMKQQLEYLQNKNLGFNKEQLLIAQINVPRGGRLTERVKKGFEMTEKFKVELAKLNDVAAICAASHDFGNGAWVNIGYTDDSGNYREFNINITDEDYIPTMKMELAAGRNFSVENSSDVRRAIIVNEAFAKEYGWTDPIGKKIPGKGFTDHEVIGVVKDFNYASLYTKVKPLVIAMDASIPLSGMENINVDNNPIPKIMIRLKPGNMAATINQIQDIWGKLTGQEDFTFTFVDQALAEQYRSDQNLGKIVSIATILAMIIGSLGLYALASLAMQNRTKEVSIRKVMGATEQSLLILLSKDYVYLIGISLLLSVPFTWYLMSSWLQSFEYRVVISWEVFALAGILSLLIALGTISYQAFKTAWTMPAETLKHE
ncbi:MAG: ABC transporter permease [Bacteroidia bacterium]|nr:ABC transporter permease [Bacteroidia bacterium]